MSYYSAGDVKNEILEPNVHNGTGSGARTEFKIQGDFFPSLKLLNLGRFGDDTLKPSEIAGQLGHIRRMTLYDGRTVLTDVREFNSVVAFDNLKGSNQENGDINRFTKRHLIGYQSRYRQDTTKYGRKTMLKNDLGDQLLFADDDDQDDVNRAYFDCREVMQMLQKLPILSSKVFPQLRLVIEYEDDSISSSQKFQSADNIESTNCRPLLALDRITNQEVISKLRNDLTNLSWMEIEHDRVQIPANTGGDTKQSVSRRIVGFNNKVVDRIRIKKNYQDTALNVNANAPVGFGYYNSLNLKDESFQLEVNDRPIFPDFSLTGENRRLAHLVDTHGDFNLYETAHQDLTADYNNFCLATAKNGKLDFFGTALASTMLRNLKLDYSRLAKTDGNANSKYKAQLEFLVSAEVQKNLVIGNGGYRITY